jgi:hypothetical protein
VVLYQLSYLGTASCILTSRRRRVKTHAAIFMFRPLAARASGRKSGLRLFGLRWRDGWRERQLKGSARLQFLAKDPQLGKLLV